MASRATGWEDVQERIHWNMVSEPVKAIVETKSKTHTISSTIIMIHAKEKFQWNQSKYIRLAPITRHVLPFFHNRQNRTKYSRILIPPRAAVTMENTVFGDKSVRYQRQKYSTIGIATLSIITKDQKMKMAM
jgi:hypothetical protein